MISRISKTIAYQLFSPTESQGYLDIYAYSIECLFGELVIDLLLLVIGIVFHRVAYIIIWTIVFTMFRVAIGGYHASSHFCCTFFTCLLACMAIILNHYIAHLSLFWLVLIQMICLMSVFYLAPVIHPNHPLAIKTIERTRIYARCLISCEVFVFFIDYYSFRKFCYILISAVCISIILAWIGWGTTIFSKIEEQR